MMEEQDVKDQVIRHVQFLMNERHWTVYRLAKEAGVPISTVGNLFQRGSCPSLPLLHKLLEALGITLSGFFSDIEEENRLQKNR